MNLEKKHLSIDMYAAHLAEVFEELVSGSKFSTFMSTILIPVLSTLIQTPNTDLEDLLNFLNEYDVNGNRSNL